MLFRSDLLTLHMMKKHRDIFIREVYRWMESDQPYTIRFGISMLMRHYLDEGFKPEYPEKVAAIRSEEYYVNMMRAWYFATALAKQYEKILPFLEEQRMDIWTHNKTIQKSIESYRITEEQRFPEGISFEDTSLLIQKENHLFELCNYKKENV